MLAEQLEAEHMARLERFAMSYVQGNLPTWVYKVLQTLQAVALYKTGEQEAVRPLGLKHPLVKTIHREVIKQNRAALQKYLEPQQISLSSAGASKLVISVRAQLEERRDFICMKLDLKNAFNEMSRAAIVEAFEAEPSLRHLAAFYGITLAPTTALEAGGIVFGEGGEGEAQGDPKAGAGFCVGLQPSLVKLDSDCREGGGSAIGVQMICMQWVRLRWFWRQWLPLKKKYWRDAVFASSSTSLVCSPGMVTSLWAHQLISS